MGRLGCLQEAKNNLVQINHKNGEMESTRRKAQTIGTITTAKKAYHHEEVITSYTSTSPLFNPHMYKYMHACAYIYTAYFGGAILYALVPGTTMKCADILGY